MSVNPGRKNGRYATVIGGKHNAPSVTTVIGKIDKPGLSWGAAKETATFAVDHTRAWANLPRDVAYDRLRMHHKKVWDEKRDRGTVIHDMAADWAAGRDVECTPDCEPYLDALEAFYAEHRPTWVQVERCVIFDHPTLAFGGCFDAVATIGGRNLLIDIKSGKRYPTEVILQLAGYANAQGMGVYDDDGELIAIEDMPRIDGAAILYLHGEPTDDTTTAEPGTFELLEVPADAQAFEDFMSVRRLYNALSRLGKWERANPAPVASPAVVRPVAPVNVEAMVA